MARCVGSAAQNVDITAIQSSLAGFAGAVRGQDNLAGRVQDVNNWYYLPLVQPLFGAKWQASLGVLE